MTVVSQVLDRGERFAHRLRRVLLERVLLGLDRAPHPLGRPAGKALDDEPAGTGMPRPLPETSIVPSVRSRFVWANILSDAAAQPTRVDRGQLVDHDLGLGLPHGLRDGLPIERIGHDGLSAQLANQVLLRRDCGSYR